jgi:23S rRNA pseudouridine2457 synthase
MTAAAGFPTLRLIRVRIGSIELADLPNAAVQEIASIEDILFKDKTETPSD